MVERIEGCACRRQHFDCNHVAPVGGFVKRGVAPANDLASSAAPADTSALVVFAYPFPTASCSGVFPSLVSRTDKDAPAAASVSIDEARP
eukprot:scaffold49816_cov63-Phaeocystis_antarctica.AAC.4